MLFIEAARSPNEPIITRRGQARPLLTLRIMRVLPGCLLLFAACSMACSNETGKEEPPPPPVDPPPPPTDNVIDVAVWPRLVDAGLTDLPTASTDELCRRMSLDLRGAIPTPEERAARCDGKTPDEMADAFLADPEFVENEVAVWIVRLREDPEAADARYLVMADDVIRALARGQLGYDDFAARILAHPAVAILRAPRGFDFVDEGGGFGLDVRDRTQIGEHAIRVFLGRAPLGDEAADFGNLFRVWTKTIGFDYFFWQAVIDPTACADPVLGGEEACTSRRFGATVTVNPSLELPTFYQDLGEPLPAGLREQLERPGRLLATRREFWDEAADNALARFTGWWRASLNQTETDLPEVREALATWFQSGERDIRRLYRAVLTSLLYRTTADASEELPPWARGPTKSMTAEQWLDSAARGLGRRLGGCDPHTDESRELSFFFPIEFRDPDEVVEGFDYYRFGTELGGCTGGQPRPVDPSLRMLGTQDLLATDFCAGPPVPSGHDPGSSTDADVERLFAFQAERLLGRRALPDELAAAVAAARDCRDRSDCDMSQLASQFCAGLMRSAAFFHY